MGFLVEVGGGGVFEVVVGFFGEGVLDVLFVGFVLGVFGVDGDEVDGGEFVGVFVFVVGVFGWVGGEVDGECVDGS